MPHLVHVLALGSGVLTAGATILIRLSFRGADAFTSYWINLVVGTVGLWLAVLVVAPSGRTELGGILYFVLAGLVGTTAGRLLRFVSIERVGASVAAALINLHPFIATALAILLLGEAVTVPIVVGTVVIVAGTVLLSAGGRLLGFRPSQLVLPFLSAACFGAVTILRKLGLGGAGPLLGFAVNVTTALVAFTAFLAASGHLRRLRCEPRSLGYLITAGVVENLGVLLGVLALRVGTVSVVAPLSGTMPLFVLALSWLFLRDIERIERTPRRGDAAHRAGRVPDHRPVGGLALAPHRAVRYRSPDPVPVAGLQHLHERADRTRQDRDRGAPVPGAGDLVDPVARRRVRTASRVTPGSAARPAAPRGVA